MIKEKFVVVKWHGPSKSHYISLGYNFTKIGDLFSVCVSDLPKKSNIIITAICERCGKERLLKMYDKDIREIIKNQCNHSFLADEVNLNGGKARIDLLDYNLELLGYEIKSDNDSFARLGRQSKVYNDTLSKVIIVIGSKFLDRVVHVVPEFWGIIHCYKCPAGIGRLEIIREAKPNPNYSARKSVEVLWKSELASLILAKGKCPGLYGKRKLWMQKRICEVYAQSELPALIAAKMRTRTNWR